MFSGARLPNRRSLKLRGHKGITQHATDSRVLPGNYGYSKNTGIKAKIRKDRLKSVALPPQSHKALTYTREGVGRYSSLGAIKAQQHTSFF